MATEQEIRDIAGKALGDPDFRQKLLDDPESAFSDAGVELAPEQLEALKCMDKAQIEDGACLTLTSALPWPAGVRRILL